jgi:glycosyltransferase involved in cell wall biosynthesis
VAQHAFEHDRFFKWLGHRRDVRPVFFIHDLLPLDFPEFFPAGYRDRFLRRVKTMQRAFALITSSQSVASRIEAEFDTRIYRKPEILVEPLPSPLENSPSLSASTRLDGAPYFLMVGTIEPRKNHDLLLHIWRSLAERTDFRARLVLVGKQGWETEQTMRELKLTPELQGRVFRVSDLSPAHLKELIGGALAVLMPSFAEGYGLPVVEALSLQTPVICSDIPVFREVSQGKARFRHLTDGVGWRDDILEMARPDSSLRLQLVSQAKEFIAPTWRGYFGRVDRFLSSLSRAW